MRRATFRIARALAVALCVVGCGGAAASSPAPDPRGTSNRRPAPAPAGSGEEVVLTEASAFVGTWALSHDSQPWCVVSVTLGAEGELVASVVRFEDVTWTPFDIVRVKLDRTAGSLELLAEYIGYESGVTITLLLHAGGVEGSADGETYGAPSVVRGARITP